MSRQFVLNLVNNYRELTWATDRLFGSHRSLTEQEADRRKDEEALFSKLPEAPSLFSNIGDVLRDPKADRPPAKRSRKTRN